ncbi:MAG: VWA-like domain-containing protein [Blautia sp.]
MEAKEEYLWEEVKELALTKFCCESPRLYRIFQMVFTGFQRNTLTGTDGETFFYEPKLFLNLYMEKGAQGINRFFLHTLFHLLYRQVRENTESSPFWHLACDMVTEYTIDALEQEELTGKMSKAAQEFCSQIWENGEGLSAEAVEERLERKKFSPSELEFWQKCFEQDNHTLWKEVKEEQTEKLLDWALSLKASGEDGSGNGFGKRGTQRGYKQEWYELQEERKRNYNKFLRRFTVEREELQLDMEAFDYIPYLYGLSHYGNLPFLEPLEYTEAKKLEELVIAIDTSASCKRPTVQRFLQETYAVLGQQENFFKKLRVHIIQCDCYVQEDVKVTCEKEWKEYLRHIKIQGGGGTDFRPVFRYVNEMLADGRLKNLKALLYFTDGDGIYPREKPDYEAVFLLTKEPPKEANVPSWATLLYMDERQ